MAARRMEHTIEYNLTLGALSQVQNRPSIRLLHDNVTLYGLVDVPSDNGGVFTDSSGRLSWGFVVLAFYYVPVLNLRNASQPFTFLFLNTNHTQLASTYIWCRPCTPTTTAALQTHSSASTSLSATSSSSAEHRVWEFSVRLFPGITNSPLTVNASSIGFNVRVFDSAGNHMSLVGANQQAQLTFIENPTSEVANSALVLPSITLMPLLFVRQPRKS